MKRMTRSICALLTASVLTAGTASAQQRPLNTEDPETLTTGLILIEAGFDHLRDVYYPLSGLQGNLTRLPTIGISVGIGPIAEIQIDGGPYNRLSITSRGDGPLKSVLDFTGDRTTDVEDIVVATNVPINDRVAIHTKQAPYMTYVVAARVPPGSVANALLWDTLDAYHYVRLDKADGEMLIVGGEDHKTGQADDHERRFANLELWLRARFPMATGILHRWSGQVMETQDHLAFAGRNPGDRHVYVATGDSGHGMTHGTIAGIVITDLIHGAEVPWTGLYDPARITLKAARTFAKENANVAWQYTDWIRPAEIKSAEDIREGDGAVLRRGAKKIAVYREELLVKQYLAAHAPPEPVSPEMIKEYYDKHPERFGGGQVRRYELLASERELSPAERDALIKALASQRGEGGLAARVEALRARGLPVVYSSGVGNEEVLHPRLRSLIAALGLNQVSELTFLEQRAFLARVTSVEHFPPKPLQEVHEEIRDTLTPVQIKKAIQKVKDQVLKATAVEYKAR